MTTEIDLGARVNGLGMAHVGIVVEDANDVTTGSLHDTGTNG
jgi:hypothetical protein